MAAVSSFRGERKGGRGEEGRQRKGKGEEGRKGELYPNCHTCLAASHVEKFREVIATESTGAFMLKI